VSAVARRYAKALFALAKESRAQEATGAQLEGVATVAEEPAVAALLRNPLLSVGRRTDVVNTLVAQLSLPDLMARFLRVLAEHKRLDEIGSIRDHYRRMLDDALGRLRATVKSARPLEPNQEASLLATFKTLTGKDVLPTVVVEPDLLGGVVVDVAGKVYDGSARTQINRLANELAGTDAF
jgi:F-type H+-transporting ATPase subunit delta